jgi:serine/threonine protein kinase
MDFVNGGHLFFQLYQAGLFEEALARVYTAEIVLALSHLHSLGIAHRGADAAKRVRAVLTCTQQLRQT